MSPEEMRVAMAEARGWKEISVNTYQRPHLWLGDKPAFGDDGKILSCTVDQRVPDYPNDLNAAHDALHALHNDEILWRKYRDYMHRFYIESDTFPPTAAQICEGILHTLGKLEDGK